MSDLLQPIPGVSVTAGAVTAIYTVPATTTTTVVNLIVINQDPSLTTVYQIWHVPNPGVAPSGPTDLPASKFAHNQPLAPVERQSIDDREVMVEGDVLYIYSDTTDITVRGAVLEQSA